jgi:hypothetical protein
VQPVRVKVYGLISLTRRVYLTLQVIGLLVAVAAFSLGLALPRPVLPRGERVPPFAVATLALIDLLPWLALLFVAIGALETWIVLRKFAHKEAEQATAQSAEAPVSNPACPPAQ